jgi:hypothetical protein
MLGIELMVKFRSSAASDLPLCFPHTAQAAAAHAHRVLCVFGLFRPSALFWLAGGGCAPLVLVWGAAPPRFFISYFFRQRNWLT